jgi:hypothetical protein
VTDGYGYSGYGILPVYKNGSDQRSYDDTEPLCWPNHQDQGWSFQNQSAEHKGL